MITPPVFTLFGTTHLVTLLVVLLAVGLLPRSLARASERHARILARFIAGLLVCNELVTMVISMTVYGQHWTFSLPLQLCDVAALLTAWMLWQRSYRAYEVAWFWAMAGSTVAMLTPDLSVGFPHPTYIHFFAGHGLIMLGAMTATVVYGFRPTLRSVWRAVLASLFLMGVVGSINILLDTNYMYLCAKPDAATLMDAFGPWPWYLGTQILVGSIAFLVCYLPFAWSAASPYVAPHDTGRDTF